MTDPGGVDHVTSAHNTRVRAGLEHDPKPAVPVVAIEQSNPVLGQEVDALPDRGVDQLNIKHPPIDDPALCQGEIDNAAEAYESYRIVRQLALEAEQVQAFSLEQIDAARVETPAAGLISRPADFSASGTDIPARARRRAASDPAGPAPATTTS
ncbi:MAG: hypothetical protein RLN76_04005 [Phycisphaeraceae bacterium]